LERERPHWSVSQLNQFVNICSLQYYFQRIAGIPPRHVTAQSVLGRAVHNAMSIFYARLRDRGRMRRKEVVEAFCEELRSETRLAQSPVLYPDGEGFDDVLEQGRRLMEFWAGEVREEEVVSIEQHFEVPLVTQEGEVLEKPLVGYFDLVVREDDALTVVDFKTLGRGMSAGRIEADLQATGYLYALSQLTGRDGLPAAKQAGVSFRWDVLVKTKTPRLERYRTTRGREDYGRFVRLAQVVEKAIECGIFLPNEQSYYCSGCGYRDACREWHKSSTSTKEEVDGSKSFVEGGPGAGALAISGRVHG